MATMRVNVSNILSLIKIKYINSSEKLNLKKLSEEHGVNYQVLRNKCSREKWNKERESILALRSEGEVVNPEGVSEILMLMGKDILTPVFLLDEICNDPVGYFYVGDKISFSRVKDFLDTYNKTLQAVQNTYNYVSPADRLKADTTLARISLTWGNNNGDDDKSLSEDTFIQALRGSVERG